MPKSKELRTVCWRVLLGLVVRVECWIVYGSGDAYRVNFEKNCINGCYNDILGCCIVGGVFVVANLSIHT